MYKISIDHSTYLSKYLYIDICLYIYIYIYIYIYLYIYIYVYDIFVSASSFDYRLKIGVESVHHELAEFMTTQLRERLADLNRAALSLWPVLDSQRLTPLNYQCIISPAYHITSVLCYQCTMLPVYHSTSVP